MSISSFNKLGGSGREILQVSLLLVAKTASGVVQARCAGCASKHPASSSSNWEAAGTPACISVQLFLCSTQETPPIPAFLWSRAPTLGLPWAASQVAPGIGTGMDCLGSELHARKRTRAHPANTAREPLGQLCQGGEGHSGR